MAGIKVGERVYHYRHGKGIVTKLISHDLAEVQFDRSLEYLERKNLTSLDEMQRQQDERKESARKYAVKKEAMRRQQMEQVQLHNKKLARWEKLLPKIRSLLKNDFVNSHAGLSALDTVGEFESEIQNERVLFVSAWEANFGWKNKSLQLPLDAEQVAAIAAINGHVQVVARAGSGKTTTLVKRALFLLDQCAVNANEILILAFNRKAAHEIRKRLLVALDSNAETAIEADINRRLILAENTGRKVSKDDIDVSAVAQVAAELNIAIPHVMTFHALAYAIVHPEESLLYDGAEGEEQSLSRSFQSVIDDHLQIPYFKNQIRQLMLEHFREDWESIAAGGYEKGKEELLLFRRSLPKQSLGGEYVKSYGEKAIADFLFEHDISYKYERSHWWDGINYRPDFTVFKNDLQGKRKGVVIEYFGLRGDPSYDQMTNEKRKYWAAKEDWKLVEFFPSDVIGASDAFKERLRHVLEQSGITCKRLSEDEIWERIKDRAIDRYTKASVGFIGRCRKLSMSPQEFLDRIEAHKSLTDAERNFLQMASKLYTAYLDRLKAVGEEDFDGLMQTASTAISSGKTLFHRKAGRGDLAELKHLFIDEFQDFSDLFNRVLQAIRHNNPELELFCVGDDWQAINGFAGSDLRFFQNFTEVVSDSRKLYISTNYRSKKEIVEVGNALMNGLGKPAVAHRIEAADLLIADLGLFEPSLVEQQRHSGDIITPAVCRIVKKALADGWDVVLLSRKNSLPWFVNYPDQKARGKGDLERYLRLVRSFFPKDHWNRLSISTAHKYKGLEKQVVIVLDAVDRSYPLIHPDWAFARILGDSPEKIAEEERRLFYVALTRAIDTLVVMTDGRIKSPFLADIEKYKTLGAINWGQYPPVGSPVNRRLVVRVSDAVHKLFDSGTYAIRESLNTRKYRWQSVSKYWEKSFLIQGFSVENLVNEEWAMIADCVVVEIVDETERLGARFSVNRGEWTYQVNRMEEVIFSNLKADKSLQEFKEIRQLGEEE